MMIPNSSSSSSAAAFSSSTNAASSQQQPQQQPRQIQPILFQMSNNNRTINHLRNSSSSSGSSSSSRIATTRRATRRRRRNSSSSSSNTATSTSPYPISGSISRPLLPTFHHNTLFFAEKSRSMRSSRSDQHQRSLWENQIFSGGLNSSGQLGIRKHPNMPEDPEQWIHNNNTFWCKGSPCSPDRFTTTARGSQSDLFSSASNCIEEVNQIALGPTLHHMGDPVLHKIPQSSTMHNTSNNDNNNNTSAKFSTHPTYLSSQCKIVMVEAGWYHTLILDSLGRVFGCGAGYGFQNGHAANSNIDYFCRIDLDEPIDFIACGGHHNLLITKRNREIISFGEGRDGQLGFEEPVPCSKPRKVPIRDSMGSLIRFKSACAGGYHSVLIDEQCNVFTFGRGAYGQLGITFERESTEVDAEFFQTTPTLVNRFQDFNSSTGQIVTYDNTQINIVHCSAGAWHTIYVADDGRVFGSGDTQYGQLSLFHPSSDSQNQKFFIPTLITALKRYKIVAADCGYFHSAFISNEGEVFTSGWNAYGNCGTGSNATCKTVFKLDMFGSLRVSSVRCGWNFTCCLTTNGSVYAFGELKHGQLPVSPKDKALERVQTSALLKTPLLLECFDKLPIAMIACGRGHTIFVTGYNRTIRQRGDWFLTQRACAHFQDVDIIFATNNMQR